MPTYIPNAAELTEPVESRTVESAALEFRTLKTDHARTLKFPAGESSSSQADLPAVADRAGKFLYFNSVTGKPEPVAGTPPTSAEIEDGSVTTAKLAAGAAVSNIGLGGVTPGLLANGGYELGMRNKIINGSIKVDQRHAGASQTFTAAAALAYCVDRFYGYCTGANITGQRIALSNGQNRYRFTGAASNTAVGFGHRIEAVNCLDLAGGTATFSVKLSSSSLTTITWTAYYANTTDTFGTLASPNRTQIATGTFTINSTEATYSTNISVPSAATTGIEIVLTGGALLAAQTLTIGDVQLEAGSVATPFEHRPFGAELALCQRYCQTGRVEQRFNYTGQQELFVSNGLVVTMRVAPTLVFAAEIAANIVSHSLSTTSNETINHVVLTTTTPGGSHSRLSYIASAEL